MTDLYILNNAIRTIKNECSNHKHCKECPMKGTKYKYFYECRFINGNPPEDWELIKEEQK